MAAYSRTISSLLAILLADHRLHQCSAETENSVGDSDRARTKVSPRNLPLASVQKSNSYVFAAKVNALMCRATLVSVVVQSTQRLAPRLDALGKKEHRIPILHGFVLLFRYGRPGTSDICNVEGFGKPGARPRRHEVWMRTDRHRDRVSSSPYPRRGKPRLPFLRSAW